MFAFLKLTRPLNLLIIALTMAAMRYGVVGAFLDLHTALLRSKAADPDGTVFAAIPHNVFHHAFSTAHFWLLVVSTMLIAAGGNVINDYFDTRIDRVNKPGAVIVGRTVKRRVAMVGHLVLSAVGLLLGVFVAWRCGQLKWALIPFFAVASLWLYSTSLKRTFLVGNIIVALLTALVPITVGLYEITALGQAYPSGMKAGTTDGRVMETHFDFNDPWTAILLFGFFAFLTTLVRELQKDMADVPGDRRDGRRTIPIVMGLKWAKGIALGQLALTLAGVLVVRMGILHDPLSYWYIGFLVIGPLLVSGGFTFIGASRKEFTNADHLMKVAMATAVGYAFLLHYTLWDPAHVL